MRGLLLLLGGLCASALASAELVWETDGSREVKLHGPDGPLVHFVVDAGKQDPHFNVLATPSGENLVWVGPEDHVWHYGLWFSWKKINGSNFWETSHKTGLQQGRNEILEPHIEIGAASDTAKISYRELSYPEREGPAVLEDSVEILMSRPEGKLGPIIEWRVTTHALEDVVLDCTPPLGRPGGRSWGGYGGFSWRGAKELQQVVFSDSEGRRGDAVHREHARWVNVTGKLAGESVGLLIIDASSTREDKPQSWYILNRSDLPFWFANPALVQEEPIELKQGESFTHAYKIIVHDGSWSPQQCEEAAEAFGPGNMR